MIRQPGAGWVMLAGLLVSLRAGAESTYVDTAQVVAATPVYLTQPAAADICHRPPIRLGDLNRHAPALNLRQALGQQDSPARGRSCVTAVDRRLLGYDVTLRYAGQQWVQRMARDPGDAVRVRVGVRAAGGRVAREARVAR